MTTTPQTDPAATQAHLADAIAHVREAMLLAGEREVSHMQHDEPPCEAAHAVEDAAVRNALLSSEDAMISVLQTLPPLPEGAGPLAN